MILGYAETSRLLVALVLAPSGIFVAFHVDRIIDFEVLDESNGLDCASFSPLNEIKSYSGGIAVTLPPCRKGPPRRTCAPQ